MEPATVSPPAGAKSLAAVTIAVPADASPGERYAVVWAELPAAVPAGGGIAAVNRVGVLRLTNGPGGLSAGPFNAKVGTTLGVGQTEPVLVALERAIPAGPWDAHIALRSGLTDRQATATLTFPAGAASSAEPVTTGASKSRREGASRLLPAAGAVAALGAVSSLLFGLKRRRPSSVASS